MEKRLKRKKLNSSKDAAFILHDSIKNRFPGSFVVKVDGSDVRRQAR